MATDVSSSRGGTVSETAAAPSETGEPTEEVSKAVIDCIIEAADEVDPDDVTPSAKLEDLDIDSLDLVEMAQVLEERFGIVIQQTDMKDVTTVGDAIEAIEAIVARIGE
jgi:acyl carrier protein